MDILSLVGLTLALVAVVGGSIAKGSGLDALWNGAAFVIVVIGTLAAALVQTRLKVFMHAMHILPWLFKAPRIDVEETIEKLVSWSQIARKEGLLGLETLAEQETDSFAGKGLQLLVDGTEAEAIRNILEVDLSAREQFDIQAAKVFESMGIYAPTLGIIGAVMGLMAVMQNLAEPDKLGPGIAAAFVATIYGIGFANLFFLPVSNKLKNAIQSQTAYREMIIDGITSIAEGENPRNIETKLRGYVL
ncbi:flagellar motor protein [Thioalkalivibrio sp.]|uniref:flagellar motor protein n=1 Tax=Thioalkalivibrio sp. TaxID=2093813 RepID=UPI003975E034